MNPVTAPRQRSVLANLASGVAGGLVVLLIGSILLATGVIDTGKTERVVQQAPINRPATDSNDEGRTVSEIYRQEGRGVVFVEARGVRRGQSLFGIPQQEGRATGSGFVIDRDGTIITNAHVVEGASEVTVRFEEEGDPVAVRVLGRDPSTDLAVLKVDPDRVRNLVAIPLGDSSKVRVGDPVVAIGNPFGLDRTVTTGIVSALQRQIDAPNGFPIENAIQTDASINPGNSGGPLLDSQGRVIGINAQIATGGGGGSVGIGFAVPVNTAKELLPRLRRGGRIERAYLGVEMAQLNDRIADDLNLAQDDGAYVQDVVAGGPADRAGLRGGRTETSEGIAAGGDLIVKVDGKDVKTPDDVADAIAEKRPGDVVEVEYFRGDERRTARVRLAKRPNQAQREGAPGGRGPPESPPDGSPFPLP